MFGDIKTVDWVSKTKLSRNRDEQLKKTFAYAIVEFHYLEDVGEFETLLESFREDDDDVENINNSVVNDIVMGENRELDKFFVMDDVSGLTDKSNEFSSFLTVSRKFDYSCLYIFHIIFPNRSTLQMILAQTKIFNIFPSAIPLRNMLKILTNNCDLEMIK